MPSLVVYIPYSLYKAGPRIVGLDSHFWHYSRVPLARSLMVKPSRSLLHGPGRDGVVLEVLVGHREHIEWADEVRSLRLDPQAPSMEDLILSSIGVQAQGGGLPQALMGLAIIHLGRERLQPLGIYAWYRLELQGCTPSSPSYRLLTRLDPGVEARIAGLCRGKGLSIG